MKLVWLTIILTATLFGGLALENNDYILDEINSISKNSSDTYFENQLVGSENQDKLEEASYDQILNIAADKQTASLNIPILMFHYIRDFSVDSPDQTGYKLSYSPEKLDNLLQYLQENNIETLTFWDIKNIAENKRDIPDKGVILTFDDGYNNQYIEAFRLLQKYQQKGVFYIITSKPDNDNGYASWAEIKEMAENGQEIGSHTINHPNLTNISDDQLSNEINDSKTTIEEHTGIPVISFCYPSGKYNDKVVSEVAKKYLFARTTEPGSQLKLDNRYKIPMVRIFPTTDPQIAGYYFGQ